MLGFGMAIGLTDNFSRTANTVIGQFNRLDNASASLSNKTNSHFAKMQSSMALTGIGASIIAPFGLAANKAMDFEAQMSNVKAVMGNIPTEQFDIVTAKAKELGATTSFSATQAGQAFEELSKAGYNYKESLSSVDATLTLATAGGVSLQQSASMMTDILMTFGKGADFSGTMVDIMSKSANSASMDVTQMMEAVKYMNPLVKGLGIEAHEAGAMIGVLANQNYKGSVATQTLSSSLGRLSTEKMQSYMKSFGVELFNVKGDFVGFEEMIRQVDKALSGMSQQEGLAFLHKSYGAAKGQILALRDATVQTEKGILKGADAYAYQVEQIKNAKGTAEKLAQTKLDNLKGDFTILGSAAEGLAINTGSILVPAMRSGIQTITGFVNKINDFVQTPAGSAAVKIASGVSALTTALAVGVAGYHAYHFAVLKTIPFLNAFKTSSIHATTRVWALGNSMLSVIPSFSGFTSASLSGANSLKNWAFGGISRGFAFLRAEASMAWMSLNVFGVKRTGIAYFGMLKSSVLGAITSMKTFTISTYQSAVGMVRLGIANAKLRMNNLRTSIISTATSLRTKLSPSLILSRIQTNLNIKTMKLYGRAMMYDIRTTTWKGMKSIGQFSMTMGKNLYSSLLRGAVAMRAFAVSTWTTVAPFVALAIPIVAVGTAIYGLYKSWQSFDNLLKTGDSYGNSMIFQFAEGGVGLKLQQFGGVLRGVWEIIKSANSEGFSMPNNVYQALKGLGVADFVLNIGTYITRFHGFWKGLKQGFSEISSVFAPLKAVYQDWGNSIAASLEGVGISFGKAETPIQTFINAGKNIALALKPPLEIVVGAIGGVVRGAIWLNNTFDIIGNTIRFIKGVIGLMGSGIYATTNTVYQFGKAFFGVFHDAGVYISNFRQGLYSLPEMFGQIGHSLRTHFGNAFAELTKDLLGFIRKIPGAEMLMQKMGVDMSQFTTTDIVKRNVAQGIFDQKKQSSDFGFHVPDLGTETKQGTVSLPENQQISNPTQTAPTNLFQNQINNMSQNQVTPKVENNITVSPTPVQLNVDGNVLASTVNDYNQLENARN